jgi:hydroxyethylthiazole kinase-like uncharacterized protein yjeF
MKKITKTLVRSLMPKRSLESFKFSNGYLSIVAGSLYFPGTVRLTALAAAKAGAGGICLFFPQSIRSDLSDLMPEAMWFSLKEHGGELSPGSAFATFMEGTQRSTAVHIGCGLGRLPSTQEFIRECLVHTELPTVIDADGLFALQGHTELMTQQSQGRWLLTPHLGEWRNLLVSHGVDLDVDPRIIAQQWNCVILLKGFPSKVYTPDGDVFENTTGNPAATTAGCGDALSAICASFLAQGVSVRDAALLGIFIAGQAADEYVQATRTHSLMASDIIQQLPITIGNLIG